MAQGRPRDGQKQRFFDALGKFEALAPRLFSREDSYYTERFVARIKKSRWWKANYKGGYFIIKWEQHRVNPDLHTNEHGWLEVRMPEAWRCDFGVLRAMAYLLIADDDAMHGRMYCRWLMHLTRRFTNHGDDLRVAFKDERVRYSKPKVLSPEAKAAATLTINASIGAKTEEELEMAYEV